MKEKKIAFVEVISKEVNGMQPSDIQWMESTLVNLMKFTEVKFLKEYSCNPVHHIVVFLFGDENSKFSADKFTKLGDKNIHIWHIWRCPQCGGLIRRLESPNADNCILSRCICGSNSKEEIPTEEPALAT